MTCDLSDGAQQFGNNAVCLCKHETLFRENDFYDHPIDTCFFLLKTSHAVTELKSNVLISFDKDYCQSHSYESNKRSFITLTFYSGKNYRKT